MRVIALLIIFIASTSLFADNNQLNKNMNTQILTQKKGVKSQKKISQLADKTRDLLNDYRLTLRKIKNTKVYNKQLQSMLDSQEQEMISIAEQIADLKNTSREITPLMVRMLDTLEKFVQLDKPFLLEERNSRIENLKKMMSRADISVSEKYRRILEAYQVENEYGRTIEAYRGVHNVDAQSITVDFFRVGRVALMYQSLDGEMSGLWDSKTKKWIELPSEYEKSLVKGIRMARKQLAPDLIKLPVSTPEVL